MSSSNNHWFERHNPLLEQIPVFETMDAFAEGLAYSPIAGLDVSRLTFMQRHSLLVCEKMPLEPTSYSLRAAMTWYGMLWGGLQARNPILPESKKQLWSVLNAVTQKATVLPCKPVGGISVQIVKGPAGTAKTVTVKRFCEMLGAQCIDHGPQPDAGWSSMRQLVFLYTMLSHDGSRGGFLTGILHEMDRVLETNYAIDLPKTFKSIDERLIAVIGRLLAHHTGIIFIDEGQLRNLMMSNQADLMQLFLLTLMNSGIPIVLVGNELAFDWINYSQDLSRLHVVRQEKFHPIGSVDYPEAEADWDAQFSGISDYYVLPQPVGGLEECKQILKQCSGGVARLGLTLWCSAQRDCLFSGIPSLRPKDILAAYNHSDFDELRPMGEGFAKRLPDLLSQFPDIDVRFYARQWGKVIGDVVVDGTEPASYPCKKKSVEPQSVGPSRSKQRSGKAKLKTEQTRNKNRELARAKLNRDLSHEDMRSQGIINLQLEGLNNLRRKLGQ